MASDASTADEHAPATRGAIVIVMGVSGCGKSTVAELLAERLCGGFKDGDDLHPSSNIDKMSAGRPLTDEDRLPWLIAVRDFAVAAAADHPVIVVACSALKRRYRDILRGAGTDPNSHASTVPVFHVFLEGSHALIASRMAERSGHFMPASMLDSQFAALESPRGEARVVSVEISPTTARVAEAAEQALRGDPEFVTAMDGA